MKTARDIRDVDHGNGLVTSLICPYVWGREKVVIIPDHYIFTKDERANQNVYILRDYCTGQNIKYFYYIKDLGNFKANPDYKGVFHVALAQEGHCRTEEEIAMSARHVESDVGTMDTSFAVTDNRGHDMSHVMDIGSHRSMRDRSVAIGGGSLVPHNPNHLIRGQYPGQVFQTAATPWIYQQLNSNVGDVGALTWNQQHVVPYIHGNFNGGCMEAANMGVPAYIWVGGYGN